MMSPRDQLRLNPWTGVDYDPTLRKPRALEPGWRQLGSLTLALAAAPLSDPLFTACSATTCAS